VENSIREGRRLSDVLEWCLDHGSRLRRIDSSLEFAVRVRQFLELVRSKQQQDALAHACEFMAPCLSSRCTEKKNQVQEAMAVLAINEDIPPVHVPSVEYPDTLRSFVHLFASEVWDTLADHFVAEARRVYGQSQRRSSLAVVMQAGLQVLKTPACLDLHGHTALERTKESVQEPCSGRREAFLGMGLDDEVPSDFPTFVRGLYGGDRLRRLAFPIRFPRASQQPERQSNGHSGAGVHAASSGSGRAAAGLSAEDAAVTTSFLSMLSRASTQHTAPSESHAETTYGASTENVAPTSDRNVARSGSFQTTPPRRWARRGLTSDVSSRASGSDASATGHNDAATSRVPSAADAVRARQVQMPPHHAPDSTLRSDLMRPPSPPLSPVRIGLRGFAAHPSHSASGASKLMGRTCPERSPASASGSPGGDKGHPEKGVPLTHQLEKDARGPLQFTGRRLRQINCPVCSKAGRMLAENLPCNHRAHSTLICFITGEILDDRNPPVALPNGRIYSKRALVEMAQRGDGSITCPRTGEVFRVGCMRDVYVI